MSPVNSKKDLSTKEVKFKYISEPTVNRKQSYYADS